VLDLLRTVVDIMRGRNPAEIAKVSAYLLAPALVIGLAWAGADSPGLGFDLGRPFTISELRTELTPTGEARSKRGIAVVVEPVPAEYHIPLGRAVDRIWSSLDADAARANADRLLSGGGALKARTPFVGVDTAVTVVVEGDLGLEVQLPGSRHRVDDWRLASRRSTTLVSSVLLACVFAFGMSLATGLPTVRGDQHATG
jgi:hypothetical protein